MVSGFLLIVLSFAPFRFLVYSYNNLSRSFTHDPEIYKEPMTFNPDRFLGTEDTLPESDPRRFVFGFGRRICPGRFLAESTLFLTIAKSLSVFDITRPIGKDGRKGDLEGGFTPGIISHPAPFHVSIRSRSEHADILIRSVEEEDPWLKGDSKIFDGIQY